MSGGRGGAGGYGTGYPLTFRCSVDRRTRDWRSGRSAGDHTVVRTGRTKSQRSDARGKLHTRTLPAQYEYRCACGHVGWTNHKDILRVRIEAA